MKSDYTIGTDGQRQSRKKKSGDGATSQLNLTTTDKLEYAPAVTFTSQKNMISFTLKGQIPSGKNAVIVTRSGHRFPAKRFKLWREDAFKQLDAQVPNIKVPADWDPHVRIEYRPGDRRRRDVPGMVDALWHLIEKYGMVDDDARLKNLVWETYDVDKERAGVVVLICNMNP